MEKSLKKRIINNLQQRNIQVEFFKNIEEARENILRLIPLKCTIGIGHSKTLEEMNISYLLNKRGNIIYDKSMANNEDESLGLKKKALTSDWYITGSNAISVDGHIVNIDHSGNRVAAMIFGPDHVLIVIGKNKIVNTLEEAIKRAKNIAAPLNAKRAGYSPPCVEVNKCLDCLSQERVCNSTVIIEGQIRNDRIKIYIIDEDIGF